MKHEHFGSSLSGALIVNLRLSFDYRFDYRSFVHQFGLKASHGIQDHLSRIIVLIVVFLGGHIVYPCFPTFILPKTRSQSLLVKGT